MERGTVVVTGASTGIGEACALGLADLGFDVLGGVRKESDGERLRAQRPERIAPVLLDIVDEGSVRRATAEVERATGSAGLAGLVNNAGIAISGPMEYVPLAELRRQLEVNVIGQVAVTQALLPALRRASGRIVNMSSIGGRIALPLIGPYAASKFALEAVSDSLRRELRPWGIHVSLIEPGGIRTPIWDKSGAAADEVLGQMPAEAIERYGPLVEKIRAEADTISREGLAASAVADAVGHALTSARPRTRYLIGRDAKLRAAIAKRVPDRIFDALVARTLGWRAPREP